MKKVTEEKLRIKLRVQQSLHVRAWISGDTIKAAKHRLKIRELKTALAQFQNTASAE